VEVQVSDPGLVEELADSLRRSAFRVLLNSSTTLTVEGTAEHLGPGAIEGAVELELDLYLQVWEATHPGVQATRLKDNRRS
jgi:hypothetical protein